MEIKMLDGSTFAFPNRRERIIFLVMVFLAALSVALIAYVSIVEYPLWFILVAVMVIVYAWFFHSAYKERKRKEGAEVRR